MMLLDDGILEHDKFVRAVRLAGGDSVHLWIGLRAYCAKKLTDGKIPNDMLSEVKGPIGRARTKALTALQAVGLVHTAEQRAACPECESAQAGGDAIWMHDYLQWSESRSEAQARRVSNRERQRRLRDKSHVSNGVTNTVTNASVTPSVTGPHTMPDPYHTIPTLTEAEERAGAREPAASAATGKSKRAETRENQRNQQNSAQSAERSEPKNRAEAEAMGACAAAKYLQDHPYAAGYLEPQAWTSVVSVSDALSVASGRQEPRKLGPYERDAGVRAVVALLAAGHLPSVLVRVAKSLPTRDWWRSSPSTKGLSSLTLEVVDRELGALDGARSGPMLTSTARELLEATGYEPKVAP